MPLGFWLRWSCYRFRFWCRFWLVAKRWQFAWTAERLSSSMGWGCGMDMGMEIGMETGMDIHKSPEWATSAIGGSIRMCRAIVTACRGSTILYSFIPIIIMQCKHWLSSIVSRRLHAHSPRVPSTILAGIGWRAGDLCPFRAFLIGDRFCALAARFVGKIYELLSVGMSLSLLLFRSRRRDFLAIFTFNFSLLLMPLWAPPALCWAG